MRFGRRKGCGEDLPMLHTLFDVMGWDGNADVFDAGFVLSMRERQMVLRCGRVLMPMRTRSFWRS
jgi:hypothetical protein